ncbi:MAG: 3'-5' exonuclease domain-containing protein 2 [Bacteroidaceae bacterium]|nr:3'-5' exonuclease domain-containing protein 2 [Bacteroidaceae bacterium]
MRRLYSSFDKSLISGLPRVLFGGRIEVIQSVETAKRAVDFLMRQPILGFDTETRPSFRKGPMHPVALLQVSTDDICFLFRLHMIDLPNCLLTLLSDRRLLKVGLSLHDDFLRLTQRRSFKPGTFVDVQDVAREMGIIDQSLRRLYANVFGQCISKSQQLSNWEADVLTDAQKRYAASDAWACIQLYRELLRIKAEGYELEDTLACNS